MSRRAAATIGAVLALGVFATACVPIAPPPVYAPNPPVYGGNFPDPEVITVGGAYQAFSTNAIYGQYDWPRVPSAKSPTLQVGSWSRGIPADALPEPFIATWQSPDPRYLYWAPTAHQFGAQWVMYYTAPHASAGKQCIGVAVSATVDGPYLPFGTGPMICEVGYGGSIDPSVFVDSGGQAWLLWKSDGNCCNVPVWIWSRTLASDGLSFVGGPNLILDVTQVWEDGSTLGTEPWKRLVEGPTMVERGGVFWLFYSGNWWESGNYATGYARCASPAGACVKPIDRALLGSGPSGAGPGGPDVVVDPDDGMWLAYHAWHPAAVGYTSGGSRSLRISSLDLSSGFPVLGAGP